MPNRLSKSGSVNSPNDFCLLDWVKRKSWPSTDKLSGQSIRIVDLFAGCGGLSLGAWEAARQFRRPLEIKLAVDLSKSAIEVYSKNFKIKKEAINCDIQSLTKDKHRTRALKTLKGEIDILVAGPPCQGHSDLNNSTRRADPRNHLYLSVVDVAALLNPKSIIIENVPSVIHDNQGVVNTACTELEKLGYKIHCIVINAVECGLPQRRKRHVLVATKRSKILFTPPRRTNIAPLSNYLNDIVDEDEVSTEIFRTPSRMGPDNKKRVQFLFNNELYELPDKHRPDCHRNKKHSYTSMYGRLRWAHPAQTITSGFGSMGQGRFVHPLRQRVLTPHDAARIQGIPDFFDFSEVVKRTDLHEMIGNAVPPRLSALVVHSLIAQGFI